MLALSWPHCANAWIVSRPPAAGSQWRLLRDRPVLLLLLGSDLHMMERLTSDDQPFFSRADNMAWRGRAVEPLARESLELAAVTGELPWPEVEAVGGWWNRQFAPEVDLVAAWQSESRPAAG